MRWPIWLILLLAILIYGFGHIGEVCVYGRYSAGHDLIREWKDAGFDLPKDAMKRLDSIILSARRDWEVVRWLSCIIGFVAAFVLYQKKNLDPQQVTPPDVPAEVSFSDKVV